MALNEIIVVDEGHKLTAGELHKLVTLLADGAVAARIDEGEPFDAVGEKPQLRLEGIRESPEAMQPLGDRWSED
jgi:hypothetical protein